MRWLLCIFSLFLCVQFCFSQTKLIAYKRHSGTNFHYALTNNTADIKDSNFGGIPTRQVKNAQLDSVIFIDDEKAIMVTSEYCGIIQLTRTDSIIRHSDFKRLWSAGKDTVYNHELFSKKHKLDSIKQVLKTEYNFKNDIEKVVFIGYDNGKKVSKKKKKEFVPPIIINPKKKDNFNNKQFYLYSLTIGVSFLIAALVYLFFVKRNKQLNYV